MWWEPKLYINCNAVTYCSGQDPASLPTCLLDQKSCPHWFQLRSPRPAVPYYSLSEETNFSRWNDYRDVQYFSPHYGPLSPIKPACTAVIDAKPRKCSAQAYSPHSTQWIPVVTSDLCPVQTTIKLWKNEKLFSVFLSVFSSGPAVARLLTVFVGQGNTCRYTR